MRYGTAVTMETREEPRFVQFSAGDLVEGVLVAVERVPVKGKMAVKYTVQEEDGGQMVAFIGTYQLNTKLWPEDKGHMVSIKCVGEDTMVKRGENCMKVFDVKVSKERVGAAEVPVVEDGTMITDADIPF